MLVKCNIYEDTSFLASTYKFPKAMHRSCVTFVHNLQNYIVPICRRFQSTSVSQKRKSFLGEILRIIGLAGGTEVSVNIMIKFSTHSVSSSKFRTVAVDTQCIDYKRQKR